MSTSQNSLFRFAELAMFRLIGAYRIGWLLDRSGMRRGKEKAKTAKTPETFSILLGETPLYRNIGDLAIAGHRHMPVFLNGQNGCGVHVHRAVYIFFHISTRSL